MSLVGRPINQHSSAKKRTTINVQAILKGKHEIDLQKKYINWRPTLEFEKLRGALRPGTKAPSRKQIAGPLLDEINEKKECHDAYIRV